MKQHSRQSDSSSSKEMILFMTLLLISHMSACVAFRPSTISVIPRIARQKIAIAPPRPSSAERKLINIDHHNINGEVLKYSPLSASPASFSSTSMSLFGKFGKGNGDKVTDEDDENIDVDNAADNANTSTNSFLKVALPSFIAGGVATLGFLFLPLLSDYNDAFNGGTSNNLSSSDGTSKINVGNKSVNNVNQPVILFETILNDLNDAYVDNVDVQKLFETGVKAMTASLDPYTEFESRLEAKELEESVTGKYGGVGLVIRGGTNLKLLQEDEDISIVGGSDKEENKMPYKPNSISSPPVAARREINRVNELGKKTANKDDEIDVDEIERKRARKKSMEEGIRVVSAFEGELNVMGKSIRQNTYRILSFVSFIRICF
jgi:hypothetical protein